MADFDPALPMSWDAANFEVVNHETGHALIGYYFKLPIVEARIDRPDYGTQGHVKFGDFPRRQLRNRLHANMAGAIATGKRLRWPPDAVTPGDSALEGDQENAALFVAALKLPDVEWFESQNIVREILDQPRMIRDSRALTSALLKVGAIPGDEVSRICAEASSLPLRNGA